MKRECLLPPSSSFQLISSILVEIEKQLEKEEPEPPAEEADEAKEGEEEGGAKEEKGAGPEDQEAEKMLDDDTIKKSPKCVAWRLSISSSECVCVFVALLCCVS